MNHDLDADHLTTHVMALEGSGVSASSYRMRGRLGRMRPLPSAQRTIFVADAEVSSEVPAAPPVETSMPSTHAID
jgi:hypothetical protein